MKVKEECENVGLKLKIKSFCTIKDRKGMDPTEKEGFKRKWHEYTEHKSKQDPL